jgi:threonine/homoserine/homoserine lactone efflux protein
MAWIGVTLLRSSVTIHAVEGASSRPPGWHSAKEQVTCLLNPKAYRFVLAVYSQFLLPQYGPVWL